MSPQPYIFRTRPHFVTKVWGGRRLETVFDKPLPDEGPFGESWEVADLVEGQSVVGSGPLCGQTLEEVVALWRADLVGTLAGEGRFPLLIKILDAARDLSIQVHPGPQHQDFFLDAHSKDETWIILAVDDGGSVLHGFREEVSAETFKRAVEKGNVVDLMRRIEVAPGDVLRVAPGTVHAICEGVLLLEIQQPSDTTYRVYDYERPGLDGKPRALHLDEAVAVTNFSGLIEEETRVSQTLSHDSFDWTLLVDVYAYRAERLRLNGELSWDIDPRSVQVLFVIDGEVTIKNADHQSELVLRRGESAIIPASSESVQIEAHITEASGIADLVVAGLGGVPLIVKPCVPAVALPVASVE